MAAKKSTAKDIEAKMELEVYKVKEGVKKGAKKTDAWVRKHPWQSVGIAAFAGLVVAKLFSRRK